MIKKLSVAAVALTIVFTGCDSLKDAMSAHSSVVAKAGGAELSVTQLANMMGKSQAPLRQDVAKAVTDAWVDYHLVAKAAVENDTLNDPKLIDKSMWGVIASIKARKWYELVSKTWTTPDSSAAEGVYNTGKVLAASHILFLTQGMAEPAKAAAKKKADAVRAQVNSANFAAMAAKNSEDPGSKAKGGSLGTFPPGAMVPQFEQALVALKPGEISPVIETQYGYHIIRRPLYSEVKQDVIRSGQSIGLQAAESTYLATLERNSKLDVKPGTAATVRAVVEDPNAHKSDKTLLATTTLGDFTAANLARWMTTIPAQAGLAQRIKSAPDSVLPNFLKNFVRNELVLHASDSAKIGPDSTEIKQIRASFKSALVNAWTGLGVDPTTLAKEAKSKGDREKLAHQKMDKYLENLILQKAQYVDVTEPVQAALREKYSYDINNDAIARALLAAATIRLKSDSGKAAGQPSSVVPVPKTDTAKR